MLKSTGRIKKTSSSRPFRDFHSSWISTLRGSLLPLLRHSMSSSSREGPIVFNRGGAMVASSDLLSTHVSTLHSHFQAFYHALDLAARHDVTQILAPHARSPLEIPYLWFGDFHPSLFTNLLRSLNPSSETLVSKVEEIERGIRLIVPNILQRYRDAQGRGVEGGAEGGRDEGGSGGAGVDFRGCESAEEEHLERDRRSCGCLSGRAFSRSAGGLRGGVLGRAIGPRIRKIVGVEFC